ncbi:MAG: O-antigen ligase family protein [Bacteroidota bacterium]|nr:O-antigen ligase family protein [Bacteroidota bacterium]
MNLNKKKIWLFYLLSFLFIALNAYALLARETFLVSLLPFGLLVLLFVFFAMDKLLWICVFFVPLSIPLDMFYPSLEFNMALPTEPLLFGLMLIFLLKQALEKTYDRKILNHPVTWAIFFMLFWMLITSITSTMPWISIKYFLSRLWFVVGFYFLLVLMLKKKKNITKFFWISLIPVAIVILITLVEHATMGFTQKTAHSVVKPFYNDHTSYGAILAMFIPILTGLLFMKKHKGFFRYIIVFLMFLFLISIVFSYTRAAWVSLIGAFGVYLIIRLKINYKWVLSGMAVLAAVFFIYQTDVMMMLEQNKQESSTDFKEHVQSISNVATDASNKERINRWNCALRMFKEKPFVGWGPGTYQFQYAPFQRSHEKTIISTNVGDMGNAHSEYLGPLSEQGVFGLLSFILILGSVLVTALNRYKKTKNKETRTLLMMSLIGLMTYFIHGFLNNFLDTDKASAPFWGFIAVIVAIDLYHTNEDESTIAR